MKTRKDGKVGDHRVMCMFIGYTGNYIGDCYRIWSPNTGRVSETRDVIFLHRMFYQDKCKENVKSYPEIIIKVSRNAIVEAMTSEMGEISLKVGTEIREGTSNENLLPDPIQS